MRVGERASETWEVEVAPGATLTRRLALRPLALPAQPSEPPRPRGSRVAPALVTLAGLGTLAAGGVTGYFAFQKVDAIAGRCPAGECEAGYDLAAAQRRARVFTTTTDVLLVSGSVLTVGGLVWYLVASSGGTREPGPPPPATAGATCSGQGCVATLGGADGRHPPPHRGPCARRRRPASAAGSTACARITGLDDFHTRAGTAESAATASDYFGPASRCSR